MKAIILVHGAWHGSWCWSRVRASLQHLRGQVFTPTLTGLGERSHLLSPDINLQTHIDDVVNLITWEQLSDVVLCGHSYAGMVITGVAERLPEKISSLVYLDAFVPKPGESLLDTLPSGVADQQRQSAHQHGAGWLIPPAPAEFLGVNVGDREMVDRLCTPQPLATFEQPLSFSNRASSIASISYLVATGRRTNSPFSAAAEEAKMRGWQISAIDCGHDVMLDAPDALSSFLAELGHLNGH